MDEIFNNASANELLLFVSIIFVFDRCAHGVVNVSRHNDTY